MGRTALEKVEAEIAEGKLGIARDRLHGLVQAYPDDMALRSRLGDVYMKLGYPVEAGRFWFLDADLSEEKQNAIDRFVLRWHGDPKAILKQLKIRCSPEVLSTAHATKRIEELIEDCKKRHQKVPTFDPPPDHLPYMRGRWLALACSLLGFVVVALIVTGAYTILKAIFGW